MKSDYSEAFERFWKLYPRKIGKRAAWTMWKREVERNDGLTVAPASEENH